jgi:predicted DCC family thiol-disulfide oxidoreductase YuxK
MMPQEHDMSERRDWPMQVFYDGACPLCSREMAHYRKHDRLHRMEMVDIAAPNFDAATYGLDPEKVQQVMHVRMADGRVFTQVRAFVKIWESQRTVWTTLLRCLLKVPGVMPLAGIFYRWFARNRYRLTGRCTPESCGLPQDR